MKKTQSSTLVMKFGGASVATPEQFSHVADLVISRAEHYERVIVVVSAMGSTTNELDALARKVNPNPPTREYDMLVTVGERISMALLAMALEGKGRRAVSFTGSQAGVITCAGHTNAKIIDVRPKRLLPYLKKGYVVIIAGFQGVSAEGEITTLGRGGTDTTAVALGIALDADKIEFYKDVPGIFAEDPKSNPQAQFHQQISYAEAFVLTSKGAKVLHPRSILLAQRNHLALHVRSFKELHSPGTWISPATVPALDKTKVYE